MHLDFIYEDVGVHLMVKVIGASAFGWCYYVRMPKGASPICFPEADLTIHPKEGEVIIFPGIVEHSVPPSDIEEKRIMIASNVGIK